MKFEPEHFPELGDQAHYAARVANELFQKWLAKQTVVYCELLKESGLTDQHGPGWLCAEPSTRWTKKATHKARLVCIEEIKKCEHKRAGHIYSHAERDYLGFLCMDCNAKLKPITWEEI